METTLPESLELSPIIPSCVLSSTSICLPQHRHIGRPFANFTLLRTLTHRARSVSIALRAAYPVSTTVIGYLEARQVTVPEAVTEGMALNDTGKTLRIDLPGCYRNGGGGRSSGTREITGCGRDDGGYGASTEEGCQEGCWGSEMHVGSR
jgi:hypothetical protein